MVNNKVTKKIAIIIICLLYAVSIPTIIFMIMRGEYETFILISLIIGELLLPIYVGIYLASCIEEVFIIYHSKYEKLYLDDLGKVFSKIGFIAFIILFGFKNYIVLLSSDNTSINGSLFVFALLINMNINGIYINEEELYLRHKNVRIPFKNILHLKKRNSKSVKLIAMEGEYDININEPNLKRLQSKMVIQLEDE